MKAKVLLNSRYITLITLGSIEPYITLTHKKIGLVCHDISESSIDFYFILCSFISFEEAKKTFLSLRKKKIYTGF